MKGGSRQDTGKLSLLAESCQADTGLPAATWENSLPTAPSIIPKGEFRP
ncbi:unnamed protein product, partial [marine sediment metagenome]